MISQETKDLIVLILICAGVAIFVACVFGFIICPYIAKQWNDSDEEYYQGLTKLYDDAEKDHIMTVGENGFIVCPGCDKPWHIQEHKNCTNCGASYTYIKHNNKVNLKYYSNLDEICEGK